MTNNPILVDRAIRTLSRAAGSLYSSILGAPKPSKAFEELESRTMMSAGHTSMFTMGMVSHTTEQSGSVVVVATTTTLAAPTSVSASSSDPGSVVLRWRNNSAAATGYNILRSTDGRNFAPLASITGGSVTSYTDSSVAPHKAYWYKVQAFEGGRGSALSGSAGVTTPVAAPFGLVASISGGGVGLTWADGNGSGVGYLVLRAAEGEQFSTIARLGAGAAKAYTDMSAASGTKYSYVIEAVSGSQVSQAGNTVSITTPAGTAAITTRYGNELVVTSYGADTISVSEVGSLLSIAMNGQVFTQAVLSAGLFIYDRAGNDTITIDRSVSVRTTITSLGGGSDSVVSRGSNVSVWLDTTDAFSGSGSVHWIGALAGNVSKAVGASLANPADAGATFKLNDSLWGTGPVMDDVRQGTTGDCFFLASLAAFAGTDPSVLTESAVDLGDGTYLVRFMKQSHEVYVRVSNDMGSGVYAGFKNAHPGADNTMWALVMEKAFAYFRTGANTYASIAAGWMSEVYTDFGVRYSNVNLTMSENSFYSTLSGDMSRGLAVTLATSANAPTLIRTHAYTLVGVYKDIRGITHYEVRNPWGVSGGQLEDSAGYATITFSQLKANFTTCTQALA